jgi:hypothetical protein
MQRKLLNQGQTVAAGSSCPVAKRLKELKQENNRLK